LSLRLRMMLSTIRTPMCVSFAISFCLMPWAVKHATSHSCRRACCAVPVLSRIRAGLAAISLLPARTVRCALRTRQDRLSTYRSGDQVTVFLAQPLLLGPFVWELLFLHRTNWR
jgi:hypothetical protein